MPEPLTYRFAAADEVDAVARLVAHSFPGSARPHDWWVEQLARPPYGGTVADTLFTGEDGGRAVAALQIHPLTQYVAGEALPTAGIGSVAIAPTHRRRGLGAELVAAGLRAAVERGDVVSSLYPFRTEFYRKLGYGAAGEALQFEVEPGMLPDSPERAGVGLIDSDAQRAETLALYNAWARTQTGQLQRAEPIWRRLTTQHDRALVAFRGDAGALEGYALAVYHADGTSAERYLELDELVWTTPAARRGLYGWAASLGDQWRRLLIRSLPSHRLADWLREPRLPSGSVPAWGLWAGGATVMMGTMFRLLDVEAAWSRRSVAGGAAFTCSVELTDAQLERNAGSWRLVLDGGRADMTRSTGTSSGSAEQGTLRLDVSTLSRLYVGSLTPLTALEAGLLECDRPELLAGLGAALALPEPWTFDRF